MDRARLLSTLLPPGVSLLIHVALLIVVGAVSITAVTLTQDDDSGSDIVLTLDNPAPAPAPVVQQSPTEAFEALGTGVVTTPAAATDLTVPPIVQAPVIAAPPAIMARPRLDTRRAVAPGAAFAGLRADRVRRVVYVVDVSGPMTSSLQFVLDELLRSISRLDSSQYFQVVLFRDPREASDNSAVAGSDPGYLAMSPAGQGPRLLPANAANRAALAEFLGTIRPGGRSNPLTGLRAALALEPDAIFLLARGISRTGPNARWGEGQQAIMAELDRLNPADATGRRPTAIKTIQFIDDDPTGLMQAIAGIHGDAGVRGEAGAAASASYTRRNVEDLQRPADTPPEALIQPPDPAIDRASAILWDLTAHRIDLRVLFTEASEDDRARVRRDAAQAMEALNAAEPAAADEELGRLIRARALLLRAAVSPETRTELLGQAIATLDTSDGAPPEVLATAACAMAMRRSMGDADAAEALARRAIEPDPNSLSALEARLAAIVALAEQPERVGPWVDDLGGAMARRPFIASGRLDAPLALLCLDASAYARLRFAGAPDAVDAALAEHLEWHATPRPGLPGEAVLTAAGELLPPDAALERLDPRLALGRGLALLPSPGERPSAECLRALDLAASRPDADGLTAEAGAIRGAMSVSLWAAGLPLDAQAGAGPRQEAVARLDRALEQFPGRTWERDAALHLASHTASLVGLGATDASIASPRVHALNVLVVRSPRVDPRSDAWRLELARRIADTAASAETAGRVVEPAAGDADGAAEDTALGLLEGPWHERPDRDIDQLSAWILSRRVARLGDQIERAHTAHDTDALHAHATALAEAARRAIPHAQPIAPEAADAVRADLAEALIVLKSPEASEIYADLRARGVTLGRSDSYLALAHARALLAQGDAPGAFTLLRDVTGSLHTPHPDDPDTFWHAWCLTLELLTQQVARTQDDSARRSATAHLLRLHTLDPALGGEPWASRLHTAALSVGVALDDADVHSGEAVPSRGS